MVCHQFVCICLFAYACLRPCAYLSLVILNRQPCSPSSRVVLCQRNAWLNVEVLSRTVFFSQFAETRLGFGTIQLSLELRPGPLRRQGDGSCSKPSRAWHMYSYEGILFMFVHFLCYQPSEPETNRNIFKYIISVIISQKKRVEEGCNLLCVSKWWQSVCWLNPDNGFMS